MAKADTPFKARRAEPGTTFGYTTPEGDQKTIRADGHGLVTARDDFEENVLISQGLSVARIEKPAKLKAKTATRKPATPASHPEPAAAPASETEGEG